MRKLRIRPLIPAQKSNAASNCKEALARERKNTLSEGKNNKVCKYIFDRLANHTIFNPSTVHV